MRVTEQKFRDQAQQHWMFFRQWMRAPLSTASVVPSSRYLAKHMVAQVPGHAHAVIELGAGTGVFTQELLDSGLPASRLMVVELNLELYHKLSARFAGAKILNADAAQLPSLVRETENMEVGEVDAVLSGLGLLNMPQGVVRDILLGAFEVLRPGAPFIQFTYGPRCPVDERLRRELGIKARRTSFTLRNFPPASVYVLSRS